MLEGHIADAADTGYRDCEGTEDDCENLRAMSCGWDVR